MPSTRRALCCQHGQVDRRKRATTEHAHAVNDLPLLEPPVVCGGSGEEPWAAGPCVGAGPDICGLVHRGEVRFHSGQPVGRAGMAPGRVGRLGGHSACGVPARGWGHGALCRQPGHGHCRVRGHWSMGPGVGGPGRHARGVRGPPRDGRLRLLPRARGAPAAPALPGRVRQHPRLPVGGEHATAGHMPPRCTLQSDNPICTLRPSNPQCKL